MTVDHCPICGISESIPSPDHDHAANFILSSPDRPPVSGEPRTVVLDANFMQNVREALENGYDRVCARCGVGVYDDSDMHERACPEYEEPR